MFYTCVCDLFVILYLQKTSMQLQLPVFDAWFKFTLFFKWFPFFCPIFWSVRNARTEMYRPSMLGLTVIDFLSAVERMVNPLRWWPSMFLLALTEQRQKIKIRKYIFRKTGNGDKTFWRELCTESIILEWNQRWFWQYWYHIYACT